MVIHLTTELEEVLREQARQRGVTAEVVALDALQERFVRKVAHAEAQDEWERKLFDAALDCGVSVPDSALSSEGLCE